MNISNVAEDTGNKIAAAIMEKYDEADYAFETLKVEREIYARALHEATAFFLQERELKFNDSALKQLKNRLTQRGVSDRDLAKSTPEELMANAIKTFATDTLLLNDIVI